MEPSRFFTSTTGEDQGLLDGSMTPASSISATCFLTTSLSAGAIRLGYDRMGL